MDKMIYDTNISNKMSSTDLISKNRLSSTEIIKDKKMIGYHFVNVCNGIIFKENEYIPMIKFKIVKSVSDILYDKVSFRSVKDNHAWFMINRDSDKLIGPIGLNIDYISGKSYTVDDLQYPEIHDMTIEALSDDKEFLIDSLDIPEWMMKCLLKSIEISTVSQE